MLQQCNILFKIRRILSNDMVDYSMKPFKTIWKARNPSSFSYFIAVAIFYLKSFSVLTYAQNFDPDVDDTTYLNKIEENIETEVNKTRVALYKKAQLLDHLAREFVAAQLKENLFIALQVLAEKEIAEKRERTENEESSTLIPEISLSNDSTTIRPSIRRKRQDDGDEDGDDGDAGAGAGAAPAVPNRPTIPPQIGLFPQVANLVRVVFGGNGGDVNFTNYVASATKLLPRPLGNQVLGIVKTLTNGNGNGNRNSFTTVNPLLGGLTGQFPIPPNFNFQSSGLPPLTQEQILALGLPPNSPLNVNGPSQGQFNNKPSPSVFPGGVGSTSGISGAHISGANNGISGAHGISATTPSDQIPGIPPGLTAADIAALAALGVPDLPNIDQLVAPTPPPRPRSTRRPRPPYSTNNNRLPNHQQRPEDQQFQSQQHLQTQQQQQQQQLYLELQQQLLSQHFQSQQQSLSQQQLLQNLELPIHVSTPAPNYRPDYVQNQNPHFATGEKDVLPLNLNPNKQSLSQIQQMLNHQDGPKYQGTPQSPSSPVQSPNFPSRPQISNNNGGSIYNNNAANQQFGQQEQQQQVNQNFLQQIQQFQQQQLQLQQQQQLQSENKPNYISGDGVLPSLQGSGEQEQPVGITQQPQPSFPHGLPNQQHLQQASIQQLNSQIPSFQQQNAQKPPFQQQNPPYVPPPPFQQQNAQRPPFQQQNTQQPPFQQQNAQQPPFQQQNAQQAATFQQQIKPAQQTPQSTTLSPIQQFENFFRPRPRPSTTPSSVNVDEDESEEDDTDADIDDGRRGKQLNILQSLFPTLLGGANRNSNQNSNNNAQQQPQQAVQNMQQQPPNDPSSNNTITNNDNNNNNQNIRPNQNNNNSFDLNQFAKDLSRGIGDVARVMPDLFRGAREGLQLIQALSSILRAFPGLADALPIT